MSSPIVQLLGEFLLEGTTKVNTADKMADVDAVGIYFSAHWCGPCRGFTPQLAKAYTQMKAAGKKFEVSIMHSSGEREIERKMPYVYYACCKKKQKTKTRCWIVLHPPACLCACQTRGLGLGLGLLPAFQSNVTLRRTVCSLSHFNEILPDFSDCSDEAVLLLSLALET